ncbi:Protein of unknown function [Lactobacillus helveticus CIRM-BIA 953]
MNAEN